jgi:mannose-6-phosphate isomerase-like protein (cupin superfamily)
MDGNALISSIDEPVIIYGSNGGEGTTWWKRFVSAGHLESETDAFEYNRIPPGSVIGQHVHTRTEEIYFVISGNGEMIAPSGRAPIGPGDVVLTPLGGQHGVENVGTTDLEFLVIEVMPESVAARLPEKITFTEEV